MTGALNGWILQAKVCPKKSVANLCCSCKDYDELATGQRREGQFTMARDLVPKICEIPADALPFLLMSCSFASQWTMDSMLFNQTESW